MKHDFLFFKTFKKYSYLIQGISTTNLGNIDFRFGNDKEARKNREKLSKFLGFKLSKLYEMDQVHGNKVVVLNKKTATSLKDNIISQTDGLITNKKNTFLMIKTADCFPVLMFDPQKKVVAVVHVGWRGAIEKIFITALLKMELKFNSQFKDILVVIGPGINFCCLNHKDLIQEELPEWKKYIIKGKKGGKSLDLKSFIKDRLIEAGIKKKNIEVSNICTSCDQRFFSHFASLKKGQTEGRFASIIGIKND